MKRFLLVLIALPVAWLSCGDDNPPPGAYPYGGTACSPVDYDRDAKICQGSAIYKCKYEGGVYFWDFEKDCAPRDVCIDGRCR